MEGCEELGFGSSKTIAEFVSRVSMIGNSQKRLNKVEEYVLCLEEEMRKIDAFKRDLPLCMFLLSDAIVYLKEVSRSWCKRRDMEVDIDLMKEREILDGESGDKKSWTNSFRLWSSDLNLAPKRATPIINKAEETINSKVPFVFEIMENKEESRLTTLKKDEIPATELSLELPVASAPVVKLGDSEMRSCVVSGVAASGLCSVQLDLRNGIFIPHQQLQQQSCRKQRRCWSPDLHKAFVSALKELGGPQAATPKQIRDLMRVEGLTSDEVKSHLQKYRLHLRRSPNKEMDTSTNQSNSGLGISSNKHDHSGEFYKDSESGSPPGPLDLDIHHENDGSYY